MKGREVHYKPMNVRKMEVKSDHLGLQVGFGDHYSIELKSARGIAHGLLQGLIEELFQS